MKQKNSKWKILTNGIFKENPVLILLLGCCSVLAISVTVSGALGMGAAMTFVHLAAPEDHPRQDPYPVLHRRHRHLRHPRADAGAGLCARAV